MCVCERVHISVLLHCVFSSESTSTHWSKDERWLDVFILCVRVCVCVTKQEFCTIVCFFLLLLFLFFFFFLWLLGSPLHLSLGRTSSRLKQPSRHTHKNTVPRLMVTTLIWSLPLISELSSDPPDDLWPQWFTGITMKASQRRCFVCLFLNICVFAHMQVYWY